MHIFKRLYGWLVYPIGYLECVDRYNTAFYSEAANLERLLTACNELDLLIDTTNPSKIYVNSEFVTDLGKLVRKSTPDMLYYGVPLIVKYQPEYYKV